MTTGAHLGLLLKNEQKIKFRQLRVKIFYINFLFSFRFFFFWHPDGLAKAKPASARMCAII